MENSSFISGNDILLNNNRFSMYSSSCPHESSCSSMTKDGSGSNEWEDKNQKYKSEDCLSIISNEFDQCPELEDLLNPEEESFEILDNYFNPRQSDSVIQHRSLQTRRSSDSMKQFSVVFLNKINRKYYSMRMGEWLKIKTKINSKVPVYLLGRKYLFTNINYVNLMGKKEFMLDFSSKFWFTYRQNFIFLPCSKTMVMSVPDALRSSDCGWGCMIRSGQMLMAQALCVHFLGRNWRRNSTCQREIAFHQQIIKWFGDTPKLTSPFSIHQIMRISDQNPGEWFGPQSVCNALTQALNESKIIEPKLEFIKIYFAKERVLYRDEISNMVQAKDNVSQDRNSNSIIFLIPLFLGSGTHCSSIYHSVLSKWLRDSSCLGIIGGKPRHSIFMIGCQDKNIIYLDPHVLQDAINITRETFPIETFHCVQPLVMPMKYLDPNCAVGFYCSDMGEVQIFLDKIQEMSTVYIQFPKGWKSHSIIEVLPRHSEIISCEIMDF